MRLINSNEFKEKLNYLNYELYNSHTVGELSKEEKDTVSWFIYHISKMVDNMPTEGAISIEWIKSKKIEYEHDRYDYVRGCFDGFNDCIDYLIDGWKKENETDRC